MILLKLGFFVFLWCGAVAIVETFERNNDNNVPPGAIKKIQKEMFRDIKDIPENEYNNLMTEINTDLDNRRQKIKNER